MRLEVERKLVKQAKGIRAQFRATRLVPKKWRILKSSMSNTIRTINDADLAGFKPV